MALKKNLKKWPLNKVVEIEWEDITSDNNGWSDLEETMKESHCVKMKSAGYLLERSKKYVKICMTQADENMGIAVVKTFPTGCVTRVRILK